MRFFKIDIIVFSAVFRLLSLSSNNSIELKVCRIIGWEYSFKKNTIVERRRMWRYNDTETTKSYLQYMISIKETAGITCSNLLLNFPNERGNQEL